MTGNNTFRINEATMIEAIEHWFRSEVFLSGQHFKVTSVKAETTYGGGFVIFLESDGKN